MKIDSSKENTPQIIKEKCIGKLRKIGLMREHVSKKKTRIDFDRIG
jgi:hypothetical protein